MSSRAHAIRLASLAALFPGFSSLTAAQCSLERQLIAAPDGQSGDGFGYRVALQGDVAAVAANLDDDLGVDSGSVYVYEKDANGTWVLARKLLASDGAAGDYFGLGLAVDGDTVLVGAPLHAGLLPRQGAVYVFARDQGGPGNWGEVAKFTPGSAAQGALFGFALDVDGDQLLVGAPYQHLSLQGAAYLYRRDRASPSGWAPVKKISSADPATGLEFGHSVTLADDVLFVSGSNLPFPSISFTIHVHQRDAGGPGNWGEVRTIAMPSDFGLDFFGERLVASGDLLCTGSPGEQDPVTLETGAVYLFGRDQGGPDNWGLVRRIRSSNAEDDLFYAEELALSDEWLVAGSIYEADGAIPEAGAAFVFGRDVGGRNAWGEIAELHASDAHEEGYLGLALALEGDELLVGAPDEFYAPGAGNGAAYAFDLANLAHVRWRNDMADANPDSLTATTPLLGSTLLASVDLRTTNHLFAGLFAFARPAEIPFPGGQVLLGQGRLMATIVQPGPLAGFPITIPADPVLCGFEVTLQAAHVGVVEPFAFSNAQDLVLGVR